LWYLIIKPIRCTFSNRNLYLLFGKFITQTQNNPHWFPIIVFALGKLFGLIGVVLAVPAAAVFVTLIDEFATEAEETQKV
jgi:predicted PurR-regulated permease PerM